LIGPDRAGANRINLLPRAIEQFDLVELHADEPATISLLELAVHRAPAGTIILSPMAYVYSTTATTGLHSARYLRLKLGLNAGSRVSSSLGAPSP